MVAANYAGGVMKTKNKGGRPSRYKAEYAEQARKLCLLGATDEALADFFAIAVSTLNKWKKDHPEFMESLKSGKQIADANVAQSLYNRALGYTTTETKIATFEGQITDTLDVDKHYPPDPTSAIFWLKNRQPSMWRDKPVEEAEQETNITKVVVEVVGANQSDSD